MDHDTVESPSSAAIRGTAGLLCALLMAAESHCGKGSLTSKTIAGALGLPLYFSMDDLISRARALGYEPNQLWPFNRATLAQPSANPSAAIISKLTETLLKIAPGHQGGHSDTGRAIADALGVPFPISMADLRRKAVVLSMDVYDLWPWLEEFDRKRAEAANETTGVATS